MKCPHCGYEPVINEFDYCEGAGRFFAFPIEMTQLPNNHYRNDVLREAIHGCPRCGIVFMNMGYEP